MTGLKMSLNCRIPKEKIPLNLNSNYRPTEGEGKTAAVIFSGCSDTSPPFQLYQLLMCGLEDAVKKKNPSRGQWSDSIRQTLAVWLAVKGQEAGNQATWQEIRK